MCRLIFIMLRIKKNPKTNLSKHQKVFRKFWIIFIINSWWYNCVHVNPTNANLRHNRKSGMCNLFLHQSLIMINYRGKKYRQNLIFRTNRTLTACFLTYLASHFKPKCNGCNFHNKQYQDKYGILKWKKTENW